MSSVVPTEENQLIPRAPHGSGSLDSSNDVVLVMSATTSRTPMMSNVDDVDIVDAEKGERSSQPRSTARRSGGRNSTTGVSAPKSKDRRRQGPRPSTSSNAKRVPNLANVGGYVDDEGDEEMPRKIRLTIVFTAVFLLVLSFVLVGVTLKMAPVIDQMVRKENEARMKMILDAAAGNSSYSFATTAAATSHAHVTTSPPGLQSSITEGG